MKHSMYFMKWLIKDICNGLEFWSAYSTLMILMTFVSLLVPGSIGKPLMVLMVVGSLLLGFSLLFKWLIIDPLKNKYKQYNQERQSTFDTIKNSK